MPASPYQVRYSNAESSVIITVDREPGPAALQRLTADIRKLDGFLGGRRGIALLRFSLDVPLSREMTLFVSEVSQLFELAAVVSIPALADASQRALTHEMAAVNNPAIRIEVRPG